MSNLWFSGFDADGGNSWATGTDETGGDPSVRIYLSPSKIEVGGETRLIVETADLGKIGSTVTVTMTDPSVASVETLTGVMEKDPFGKAHATWLVTGLVTGETTFSATLNG